MIKKLFYVVISLLVIAALALPYVFGVITEKQYKQLYALQSEQLTSTFSNFVQLELEDYKRGWFRSHAKAKLIIQFPSDDIDDDDSYETAVSLVENETIYHGPILFKGVDSDKFKLSLGMAFLESKLALQKGSDYLKDKSKASDFANTRTRINFDNSGHMLFSSDNINFQFTDSETMQGQTVQAGLGIDKLTVDIHFGPQPLSWINSDVSLNGLFIEMSDGKQHVEIKQPTMTYQSKSQLSDSGLWLQDYKLTNPSVMISFNGTEYNVINADQQGSTTITNGMFNVQGSVSLENFTVNDKSNSSTDASKSLFGPLEFTTSVDHIDVASLEQLMSISDGISLMQPLTEAEEQRVLDLYVALLGKGPKLSISPFKLTVMGDTIDINAYLKMPDLPNADVQNAKEEDIEKIMLQADGSVDITTGNTIMMFFMEYAFESARRYSQISGLSLKAQSASQLLQEVIESGLIQQNGDSYQIKLTYNNGQALVNGKPLDPGQLMMDFVEMPQMPGAMQQMPGGMQQMPGGMQQMPGGMQQMPGGMQQMPGAMQQMPEAMQQAPGGALECTMECIKCQEQCNQCQVQCIQYQVGCDKCQAECNKCLEYCRKCQE